MGFHLKRGEKCSAGLFRILQEQVSGLTVDLQNGNEAEAVHEAHKRCKRARTVFRLLQLSDEKIHQQTGDGLRNLARSLSSIRDAYVELQTFADVAEEKKDGKELYAELEPLIIKEAGPRSLESEPRTKLTLLSRQARVIKSLLKKEIPHGEDGFDLLQAGLRKSYRRGRKAMKRAVDQRKKGDFHRWRKRVKELGYQMQLLRKLRPAALKPLQKHLNELGEILGKEHDLMVLRQTMLKGSRKIRPGHLARSFQKRLERRAFRLQSKAHALGLKIYSERPKDFAKRLTAC